MSLQNEIVQWANLTFPRATTFSIMAHLEDEFEEFKAAVQPDMLPMVSPEVELLPSEVEAIQEEAADLMHLLFQVADKFGFDLLGATREKFEINKTRIWGDPDDRGVVRHVESAS